MNNREARKKELERICNKYGCTLHQMRGSRRGNDLPLARKEFSTFLRSQEYSLPKIGKFLNKDHTTILHHLKV